ncbi:MAG: peptidoglycan DD-metalloendopeptidase family protein [Rickettsiales bacterium]|nr:peptidoglycan DD-metalloendopeptidase family protein [Rickettsiales bacterium]
MVSSKQIAGIVLTVCASSQLAFAQTATEESLNATLEKLKETKEAQQEIGRKIERVKKEMASIQKEGVTLAKSIKEKEHDIDKTNEELTKLQGKRDEHNKIFEEHRKDTARLLQAMVRMQRMPKEFVIAMPGKEDELLRTASALHVSYGAADIEMQVLAEQLRDLNMLESEISDKKQQLKFEKKGLKEQQRTLDERIAERQKLNKELNTELSSVKTRIALLSRESKSLKELLGRLNEDKQLFSDISPPQAKPSAPNQPTPTQKPSIATRKGEIPYPTTGRILHRFGEKKGPNDRYKGHVLQTAKGAQVTALHGGRVVFTGDFMDYGNMVIIEHGRGYHSLLSGFNRINVEPGQQVITGEPIGAMGSSNDSQKLYLELRKNSKPIDPALWMGNVSRSIAAN